MPNIGQLITDPNETRDAIHVAVAPMIAYRVLAPGQHVGLVPNSPSHADVVTETVGIVDPYLTRNVKRGERFWLFLYPNTVTSLRHDWLHPAFPVPTSRHLGGDPAAIDYLQRWADNQNIDYSEMMMHAEHYLDTDEYWIEGGRFEGIDYPDSVWWDNYERATGRLVSSEQRGSFFSCSC